MVRAAINTNVGERSVDCICLVGAVAKASGLLDRSPTELAGDEGWLIVKTGREVEGSAADYPRRGAAERRVNDVGIPQTGQLSAGLTGKPPFCAGGVDLHSPDRVFVTLSSRGHPR